MGKVEQAYKNEMTDKRDEVFEGVQGERLPLCNFVAVGDKITTGLLVPSAYA